MKFVKISAAVIVLFVLFVQPVMGQSRLISPSGEIFTSEVTFKWKSYPADQEYKLQVRDASNKHVMNVDKSASKDRYTDSQGGYYNISGPHPFNKGKYKWKVKIKDHEGKITSSEVGIFEVK